MEADGLDTGSQGVFAGEQLRVMEPLKTFRNSWP